MKRLVPAVVALVVVLAACGGSSTPRVASLEDGETTTTAADQAATQQSMEEAILAFAQCMRDNGVPDFQDPDIGADGSIQFRGGPNQNDALANTDPDTLRQAFQTCQGNLEGLAFGPGTIDRSEIEDRLYQFAACMRENGYDMPDPDLSTFGPPDQGGQESPGTGPFGDIDPEDPAFQTALQACRDVFGGGFVFGGPGRGPGGPDAGASSSSGGSN